MANQEKEDKVGQNQTDETLPSSTPPFESVWTQIHEAVDHVRRETVHPDSPRDDEYFLEAGGALENERLARQNSIEWGTNHLLALRQTREQFEQEGVRSADMHIVELGTGADATLVKNIRSVFPDSTVTVIELNHAKVEQAKASILSDLGTIDGITFVAGEASAVLPTLQRQATIIDAQCFFQWAMDTPPPGQPTYTDIATASAAALDKKSGRLLLHDLVQETWAIAPHPESADDPDVQRIVLASREFKQLSRTLGWDVRTAHWGESPQHIRDTFLARSQLVVDESLQFPQEPALIHTKDDIRSALMGLIVPTLLMGVRRGIIGLEAAKMRVPQEQIVVFDQKIHGMRQQLSRLIELGDVYLSALKDPRIQHTYIPMARMAFRHQSQPPVTG